MENYVFSKKLGINSNFITCLMQHKQSDEELVFRRIACDSKKEASEVLEYSSRLASLKHQALSRYQEGIVEISESNSEEYFAIVVEECHPFGSLRSIVRKRGKQGKSLEEGLIKKWLARIVEGLVYAHDRGIAHGALKPKNVFLTKDLDVIVGNFSLPLQNLSMESVVPEASAKFSTDSWFLGCLLLQLATCHLVEETQIATYLTRLKKEPGVLENLLQRIMIDPDADEDDSDTGKYSIEFCSLVRTLLLRNSEHRPHASDLQMFAYVQECLEIIGSSLVAEKYRPSEDAVQKVKQIDWSPQEIFSYLKSDKIDSNNVFHALGGLKRHIEVDGILSLGSDASGNLEKIFTRFWGQSFEIAAECCFVILEILSEDLDISFGSDDFLQDLPKAMRTYIADWRFQVSAIRILTILSADEDVSDKIGRHGGVQGILVAWRTFPHLIDMAAACCSAFSCLSIGSNNAAIVSGERVIYDVIFALRTHGHLEAELRADEESEKQVWSLVERACAALLSLSSDQENLEYMIEQSLMDIFIDVLLRYGHVQRVVKSAALAMAFLAEYHPDSALKFCHESGIPVVLVVRAYDNFNQDPEIVENVCTLVQELAEHRAVRATLLKHPVLRILKEVVMRFEDDVVIVASARRSIELLLNESETPENVRSKTAKKARIRRQSLHTLKN